MMSWAMTCSQFNYVMERMPGNSNVWVDMLTTGAKWESTDRGCVQFKLGTVILAPLDKDLTKNTKRTRAEISLMCFLAF